MKMYRKFLLMMYLNTVELDHVFFSEMRAEHMAEMKEYM